MKKQLLCLLVLCLVIPMSSFKAPLRVKGHHVKKASVIDIGGFRGSDGNYYRLDGNDVTKRVVAVHLFDVGAVADYPDTLTFSPSIVKWKYTAPTEINLITTISVNGITYSGDLDFY